MRALIVVLCSFSIAAGIIVARIEHEAEKSARAKDASLAPPSGLESQTPVSQAKKRGPRRKPFSGGVPDDVLPEEDPRSDAGPEGGESNREAASPALAREIQDIGALIRGQEFAKAEAAGNQLAERLAQGPASVREDALRLAAKARVFARLAEGLPSAPPTGGEQAIEVLLSNGSTVQASRVDEEADRYVIKLSKGGTYVPRKEEVLEVRRARSISTPEEEWKKIEPKIAKLEHPIDLYLDGVQRCYQLGLKARGAEILERILSLKSSEQIPLLFVPDADARLLRDWRVAAGREKPPLPGSPVAVASAPPGPRPDRTEVAPATAPSGPADTSELLRAAQLVAEAQTLYQGAAGKEGEGMERDLRKARDRLDRAFEILDPLPQDDESVKRLRRQLAQLLSDVARASPF